MLALVGPVLVADQLLPGAGAGAGEPANNGYKPGFAAALMLKDLKLAREAAHSVHASTVIGGRAAEIYREFADQGHGGADFSAIVEFVREQSKRG